VAAGGRGIIPQKKIFSTLPAIISCPGSAFNSYRLPAAHWYGFLTFLSIPLVSTVSIRLKIEQQRVGRHMPGTLERFRKHFTFERKGI
jgi:hypothetical protein